jgi:hypothetical protein
MIPHLIKECKITAEQAEFLVDMSREKKTFFSEWLDISDTKPKITKAMTLIEENNPSHTYYEKNVRREDLFNLGVPDGGDIFAGYDEMLPGEWQDEPNAPMNQPDEFDDDLPF